MNKLIISLIMFLIFTNGVVFSAELPEYSIASIDDASYYSAKRFEYNVVVKEKPSTDQLKNIAKKVIKKAKSNNKFNAIIIGFYDYEEYIGSGYTLGKVTYAPKGKWDKADTVNTGNYSEMSFNYELKNKDWDKQLKEKEVKIWSYFDSLLWNSSLSEEEISQKTSNKFNISEETVKDIYNKQSSWLYSEN